MSDPPPSPPFTQEELDPLAELIATYNDLNPSHIDELTQEPSPLEFMRYVARNTPFVIRGAAADWTATTTWGADFLKEFLGGQSVNVAVTPGGNADAPTLFTHDGGEVLLFAKPHEEDQPFTEFLDYIIAQEKDPSFPADSEVRYAQTQNNNLHTEYTPLLQTQHIPPTIPFAQIALGAAPDASNLWIGNSRSVTAMHKDNYENIYVQVLGKKHFVLLPGLCQPCVNEWELLEGTYLRVGEGGNSLGGSRGGEGEYRENEGEDEENQQVQTPQPPKGPTIEGSKDGDGEEPATSPPPSSYPVSALGLKTDPGNEDGLVPTVPFAIWDPDDPAENQTPYSHLAKPVRVTLEPGDMLYLPAMWYHKVSQSTSEEGICVAVNYWYDMDFTGPLYPFTSLVRRLDKRDTHAHRVWETWSI